MKHYNIDDFGAKKGELSTCAIQAAIDACAENGGGTVFVTGGSYVTGTLFMKSYVHLYIDASATLIMSNDIADFPDFACEWNVKAAPRNSARCMIYVGNCENVTISGTGTIDCNGRAFCIPNPEPKQSDTDPFLCQRMKRNKPDEETVGRMIFVMKSKNVTLSDFTMSEMAGGWGIWVNGSEYINIRALKIYCCPDYPNSDGIHVNCSRDVFISDCAVHTGDDAIIVRANTNTLGEDIPCENVVLRGCTLSSHCQAIRIGWIGDGAIRNCVFSDIVITDSRDAITIELPYNSVPADLGKNSTRIERLSFNNILVDRTARYPIQMVISDSPLVRCEYMRNIQFNNMNCRASRFPRLVGRKDCYIEDVVMKNCRFDVTDKAESGFKPRYVRGLKTDCEWNVE